MDDPLPALLAAPVEADRQFFATHLGRQAYLRLAFPCEFPNYTGLVLVILLDRDSGIRFRIPMQAYVADASLITSSQNNPPISKSDTE